MRKISSSDPSQSVNNILPNHKSSSLDFWSELDEISSQSVVGGNLSIKMPLTQQPKTYSDDFEYYATSFTR